MFEALSPLPQRKQLRLSGYNYAQIGAYFVTICAHERKCIFGELVDGEVRLNQLGRAVSDEWLRTPNIRSQVHLDLFVVMPNHFHGILMIEENPTATAVANQPRGRMQAAPTARGHFAPPAPSQTIGAIIRGFKGAATSRILRMLGRRDSLVWQRSFHEHIIRDDEDLERIREYIDTNPARWREDKYNPERT